jgi:hypothetical protein
MASLGGQGRICIHQRAARRVGLWPIPLIIRSTSSSSGASRPSFSSQINTAISQVSTLPDVPDQEDSDEWLNIDAQDFDEMLEKATGSSKAETQRSIDLMDIEEPKAEVEDRLASAQATKLKELAEKVEQFVEGDADIEGARFEE